MKRISKGIGLAVLLSLIATLLPGAALGAGYTVRVSVATDGTQGNSESNHPAISSDGRYVAFESASTNMITGDTNNWTDIFVHDRRAAATTRASLATGGVQVTGGASTIAALSANGRYVAFQSMANNLVPGDNNNQTDIFVYDTRRSVTQRVSVATGGGEANDYSTAPSISADGRYVAFDSGATNLVADDTNGRFDVFVHDRKTHKTERVSVATGGIQSTGGVSSSACISGNGRYVAFGSGATNLVAGDTNGLYDVFVYDRKTHKTERVSVATGGVQATGNDSTNPSISHDGRYVAFESEATNLVAGDTNGQMDIFVHDRKTHTTERVSLTESGGQVLNEGSIDSSISANGNYVAFYTPASNLVSDDTNVNDDVFVYDRSTGNLARASVAADGAEGDAGSSFPALSGDGRFVAFTSLATNLVDNDTNTFGDIFVVNNPVAIPSRMAPASFTLLGSGKDKIKLSWRLPAGIPKKLISKFEIQLATDSAFTNIVKTSLTKKTALQVKGLLPVTTYYWRVRLIYKEGSAGGWAPLTGLQSFETQMTAAPKLVKPRNNSLEKKTTIKLTWKRPKGAPKTTAYTLEYSTDPGFTAGPATTTLTVIAGTKYIIDDSHLPVNTPPQVYYWHVKATSADGLTDYSDWSTARTFLR